MRVVNIDLDGCVYPDLDDILKQYIAQEESDLRTGLSLPRATTWEFWKDWGMSKGEWNALFRRGVEVGYIFRKGQPVRGAVDALWRMSDDGWFVRIVTHRLAHARNHRIVQESTAAWLDEHNIPYRSIAYVGNGEFKQDYSCQLAVDDKLNNLAGMQTGQALLFDRPHNRGVDFRYGNIRRVHSWKDVLDYA